MSQLFGMVGNGLKAARRIKVEPDSQPRGLDAQEIFKIERNALLMVGGTTLRRPE